jgi:chorismate-pyruvate lyase
MSLGILRIVGACCALLFMAGAARPDADVAKPMPVWPGSFTARLEALALLQTLNADLLSHDSATLTLERWCDLHRLASPARIVAEKVRGADKVPTAEQRRLLQVSATEPIRYRRVRLRCGGHVLSEADNWYVPGRLTAEMNRQLDGSDVAFGRAVQALHFQRRTLSAKLLWSPLPQGWEMAMAVPAESPAALPIPFDVLEHRAVLTRADGMPFSEVVETYTSEVLAFPAPPRP